MKKKNAGLLKLNPIAVFLKSASFVGFTDKNFKCLTEIKILSVQMSDTKIQDVLHRIRTCLTENYPVWHDGIFLSDRMSDKLNKFQEVCHCDLPLHYDEPRIHVSNAGKLPAMTVTPDYVITSPGANAVLPGSHHNTQAARTEV